MADEMKRGRMNSLPTHPGEVLREDVIPDLGISVTAFAEGVHTSRQTLHKIFAEQKSITLGHSRSENL